MPVSLRRPTPRVRRRHALALALLLPALGFAQPAGPGGYPQRAVRLIVPFPPGGFADMLARLIAADLAQSFGQPVLVENRAGAGGVIGAEAVARSAPDGHTLLMGTIGTHAINPALVRRLAYDPLKDFAAISFVADAETVLVVPAASPSRSVAALIAQARANPGQTSYASAGPGSTSHLAAELFRAASELSLIHVPYKGNAPALTDLVAGQVSLSFATLQTALPHIRAGRLLALATLGTTRSAALPAVPTLDEAGVKGVSARNWIGLYAPMGTPEPILTRVAAEVERTLRSPEVQARLQTDGLRHITMGPDAFAAFTRSEALQWGKVVRGIGIQPE